MQPPKLYRYDRLAADDNVVYIAPADAAPQGCCTPDEWAYATRVLEGDTKVATLNDYRRHRFVVKATAGGGVAKRLQEMRLAGVELWQRIAAERVDDIRLANLSADAGLAQALVEGLMLKAYAFDRYKSEPKSRPDLRIGLSDNEMPEADAARLACEIDAVYAARDLVNEPANILNATRFAAEMETMSRAAGVACEVLGRAQIEAQRMGGLLAVNAGSTCPPTFTIMEHKPADAVNKRPVVLVGKGIVYDSGGLSLKPTEHCMDEMKSDMAGGATVASVVALAARLRLPLHVVALVPATDNRLGADSYAPSDIIRMRGGQTVEVVNSDAEGRLILADALSYAQQYDPLLTVDVATLTGAAIRAVGDNACAVMGNAPDDLFGMLLEAGDRVHERAARLPFWDDYDEELKSEVADLKNCGSGLGGAITAGKFLEKFAPKPFMHIDIAGPAFYTKKRGYYAAGGTGFGVRLLAEFLNKFTQTLLHTESK